VRFSTSDLDFAKAFHRRRNVSSSTANTEIAIVEMNATTLTFTFAHQFGTPGAVRSYPLRIETIVKREGKV
jgi:hypothetical protein